MPQYDFPFMKDWDTNADEKGLSANEPFVETFEWGSCVRYRPSHIPYSKIATVKIERLSIGPIGLVLCGLVNPLYWQCYFVNVNITKETRSYVAFSKIWIYFPFWLVKPFYTISEDRKTEALTLAESFEYLRMMNVFEIKDVDWTQFRTRKIDLKPEQAMAAVRSSLELMGRQLAQGVAMDSVFEVERMDRSGFAFKLRCFRVNMN